MDVYIYANMFEMEAICYTYTTIYIRRYKVTFVLFGDSFIIFGSRGRLTRADSIAVQAHVRWRWRRIHDA